MECAVIWTLAPAARVCAIIFGGRAVAGPVLLLGGFKAFHLYVWVPNQEGAPPPGGATRAQV